MTIAERIQGELAPLCEPAKCAIAGSIRRARENVNDIDLVVLPRPGQLQAIKARCKQRCRIVRDGEQNFICAMRLPGGEEFQLDIFFAHAGRADLLDPQPGNFGTLLICRTGSKEHNIKICQAAKAMDMKWQPYAGVIAGGYWDGESYRGGKIIASETEESIFEALGMKWISPVYREVISVPFAPSVPLVPSQIPIVPSEIA